MRITICFLAIFIAGISSQAQQNLVIPIETKDNALLLTTDGDKRLMVTYFGKRLTSSSEYAAIKRQTRLLDGNAGINNSAYTPSGSWSTVEPAIQVTHADGNTSLDLQYVSHNSTKKDDNVTETAILLKDPVYPFEVVLHYRTFAKENVMEQWTVIRHQEKKPIVIQKMASANLYFYGQNFYLTHYHGTWAQEMRPEEVALTAGIKTLDSKLGTRADMYQAPSFMVSFDKPATENEGDVLLGTLSWSGNFRFDMEVDTYHNLRLIAGMNSY
ncbi:MAG: glycoside hydrolase family 36 N-terminal domain-containing protein, partial [Chitinophagaceae bacterium]